MGRTLGNERKGFSRQGDLKEEEKGASWLAIKKVGGKPER